MCASSACMALKKSNPPMTKIAPIGQSPIGSACPSFSPGPSSTWCWACCCLLSSLLGSVTRQPISGRSNQFQVVRLRRRLALSPAIVFWRSMVNPSVHSMISPRQSAPRAAPLANSLFSVATNSSQFPPPSGGRLTPMAPVRCSRLSQVIELRRWATLLCRPIPRRGRQCSES